MPRVSRDGVPISYCRRGTGPVVVVPECNLEWSAYGLDSLLSRFTVVAVSPRGFMGSGRLTAGAYSARQITGDIEWLLDQLGVGGYAAFGYSLNGAVASCLALGNPRVKAVVCGGFPTAGRYAGVAGSRREQLAERRRDPKLWAETLAVFDPAAVMALWESIGELPAAALVAGVQCPVWSWWGADDALFDAFGGVSSQRAGIDELGLPYRELPGLDHDQALAHCAELLPSIADWLQALLR